MKLDLLAFKRFVMCYRKLNCKYCSAPAISYLTVFYRYSLRSYRTQNWRSLISHSVNWQIPILSP